MSEVSGRVAGVSVSAVHGFGKNPVASIHLVEGLGVEGDAHAGAMVQHRSRAAKNPAMPNLRQVHLIQVELFEDLATQGHTVHPGDLGENITTTGIDLLSLPAGTVLAIGREAQIRLTGLRNPCRQIDGFQSGLTQRVTTRDASGNPHFRAGAMAVVTASGLVEGGDPIGVVLPRGPYVALTRV